jgi:hypothetical protein
MMIFGYISPNYRCEITVLDHLSLVPSNDLPPLLKRITGS